MDNDEILSVTEPVAQFLRWIHNQLSPTQIREAPANISEISAGMILVHNELVARFERGEPVKLELVRQAKEGKTKTNHNVCGVCGCSRSDAGGGLVETECERRKERHTWFY